MTDEQSYHNAHEGRARFPGRLPSAANFQDTIGPADLIIQPYYAFDGRLRPFQFAQYQNATNAPITPQSEVSSTPRLSGESIQTGATFNAHLSGPSATHLSPQPLNQHALSIPEAPELGKKIQQRKIRDESLIKVYDPSCPSEESKVIDSKDYRLERASDRKYPCYNYCEWCTDSFSNTHYRMKTDCCGLLIGSTCIEEAFSQDDTCWSCGSGRRISTPLESVFTEARLSVHRLTGEAKTTTPLLEPKVEDNTKAAPRACSASKAQASINETSRPLFQATAAAKESFMAKELVDDALIRFLLLLQRDDGKLREKDKVFFTEKALKALSNTTPGSPIPTPPSSTPITLPATSPPQSSTAVNSESNDAIIAITGKHNAATSAVATRHGKATSAAHTASGARRGPLSGCYDCQPLKQRISEAMTKWHVQPGFQRGCLRCETIREIVRDVVA